MSVLMSTSPLPRQPLNEPGGGRAALWQRPPQMTTRGSPLAAGTQAGQNGFLWLARDGGRPRPAKGAPLNHQRPTMTNRIGHGPKLAPPPLAGALLSLPRASARPPPPPPHSTLPLTPPSPT